MKRLFKLLLLLFLLFQLGFSYYRYYQFPLDGDLASLVVPDKWHKTVLNDPFGFNVVLYDSVYSSPNRFFAIWTISKYFKNVPVFLQTFTSPINSIYVSCALAKTIIHFGLLFILVFYITGRISLFDSDNLLVAALIIPLFQTHGYNSEMGIIDHSITYTFFYALPLLLLLIFFFPFFNAAFHGNKHKFSRTKIIFVLTLAVIILFNGPLNPAVLLVICLFVLLYQLITNYFNNRNGNLFFQKMILSVKKSITQINLIFVFVVLLCIYSLFIGRNNSENLWASISLTERYSKLFNGFHKQFFVHLGLGLLIFMVLMNYLIIKQNESKEYGTRVLFWIKCVFILSAIYILLLPFGGYREYRPNILRYDTFMPVTIALILSYGWSSYYIIKELYFKQKIIYFFGLILFSLIFINADAKLVRGNTCERMSLRKIAYSQEEIVALDNNCWIMTWGKTTNYLDSEIKCDLLRQWNVVKGRKYFYQK